ncbi:cell division protein FtsZ [Methylobacillus gramineus]|uniref:cell division protein ZipA C-terminal FtsZ-binding domain-containing protein n=1 Tax=Methylobacillus gramineus TaxID=755169 RepID=UPI001CFF7A01|nr:cell division protein ZipA C-terminal FtsZ-binding domain-containing protein [Methylobacillus gramineus]MCB5184297.1 cell division protein FtsZ [Methylobacillus gramineus]
MTDLHWALIALGAVIIGAVLIFNWWQERKLKKETSSRFDEPRYDALMEEDQAVRNEEFQINTSAILKEEVEHADEDGWHPADQHEQDHAHYEIEPEYVVPQETDATDDASHLTTRYEEQDAQPLEEVSIPPWQDDAVEDAPVYAAETAPDYEPEYTNHADGNVEPEYTAPVSAAPAPIIPQGGVTLPREISQQIDFSAILYLAKPATGRALREFLLSITDIDKPVYAYGLGGDNHWYLLTREQESASFNSAVCSLQLADRSGAVSTGALSRFHMAVEELAQSLGAEIEWLHADNPLQYSTELDQFCIEVDQMVGFHLTQGGSGPFTGTKFRGLAEAGGLTLGADGGYHYEVEGDAGERQVLFSVVNHDNHPFSPEMLRSSVIRGLTFQLDIPRVKSYAEAYNHMVLLARQMEHSLGAHLVDDKQRELGDVQIDKIRQQIKLIHDKMQTRGIAPGEPYALRLFS